MAGSLRLTEVNKNQAQVFKIVKTPDGGVKTVPKKEEPLLGSDVKMKGQPAEDTVNGKKQKTKTNWGQKIENGAMAYSNAVNGAMGKFVDGTCWLFGKAGDLKDCAIEGTKNLASSAKEAASAKMTQWKHDLIYSGVEGGAFLDTPTTIQDSEGQTYFLLTDPDDPMRAPSYETACTQLVPLSHYSDYNYNSKVNPNFRLVGKDVAILEQEEPIIETNEDGEEEVVQKGEYLIVSENMVVGGMPMMASTYERMSDAEKEALK